VGCQCAGDKSYWDNPCAGDLVCCMGDSGQRMCLPRDTCFSESSITAEVTSDW
jgi:hypothetical protein